MKHKKFNLKNQKKFKVMKIEKIIKNRCSIVKLKLLQIKNYKKSSFIINLKIEDIQYRLVKSFKIIHKYNIEKKTIFFLDMSLIISVKLKRLFESIKHNYKSSLTESLIMRKNDLLIILNEKFNSILRKIISSTKIPTILVMNYFCKHSSFLINYKILGNFLLKKNQYSLLLMFFESLLKK